VSFALTVTDSAGEVVHCGRGGIQLLAKGSVWHADAKMIDPKKLFAEMIRDSTAVGLALGGLLEQRPACGKT
jgi:hypothetical protein